MCGSSALVRLLVLLFASASAPTPGGAVAQRRVGASGDTASRRSRGETAQASNSSQVHVPPGASPAPAPALLHPARGLSAALPVVLSSAAVHTGHLRDEAALGLSSLSAVGATQGLVAAFFGVIMMLVAGAIQWFNEERSARAEALFARGLEDVLSVEAEHPSKGNRGRLVHVQGIARGAAVLKDPQFREVAVSRCLKLQSNVEVFQWVQTTRTWYEGRIRRSQPRFHSEWSTAHHDSLRFRKPSPENPRPPAGLCLGTSTQVCGRVELGGFVLPKDMVNAFQRFEPAMAHLPRRITTNGLTFFANDQDGYYYARPSASGSRSSALDGLFTKHEVGDVRVRFLCVPETDATVVAVQCHKEGCESFVPYRPVPLGPCVQDWKARQTSVEEGFRPLREFRSETSCCAGSGMAGCCCCACNTIACICSQEVVTEEIYYVSDRLDPVEQPFKSFVPRSPWRVWNFRLLGLLVMFMGMRLVLRLFSEVFQGSTALAAYGGSAGLVVTVSLTLASFALSVSAAAACYRPMVAARWLLVAGLILAMPLLLGLMQRERDA